MTINTGGNVTGGIFLIFGLILISEYNLGNYSMWIGAVFTLFIYPFAVLTGYRHYSQYFLLQGSLALFGVVVLIILYGAVLLRHEFRHRQDVALLETRVKERTADLEKALTERSVMLQEIHHRVKNNLQIITSLLRLEAENQGDASSRSSLETSVQRIFAMALVHETLYDTDQLDEIDVVGYSERLLESARSSSSATMTLKAVGPILVGLDFAVPFGLLLNELISVTEQNEFPTEGKGTIDVRIEMKGGIQLYIEDNGAGGPEDLQGEEAKTLGLNLVKVLVQQLRGKIVQERTAGTRWAIRFPAKEAAKP